MRRLRFAVVIAAAGLIGATPTDDVESLLRQGGAAFAAGDYAAAARLFGLAEDLTDDPGRIAFDRAAALYRQALQPDHERQRSRLLAEAERGYRHCLEDATGARRWAALYGLGNSLLQQHPTRGRVVLFDAIAAYEPVLAAADADPAIKDDARHNLELAKLLWAKEQTPADDKHDPPNDPRSDDPTRPKTQPKTQPNPGGTSDTGNPDKDGPKVPVQPDKGPEPIKVNDSPAPGSGNLPPPPESPDQALPPGDALEHVRRAVAEILREKREFQRRTALPPARGVKDW